MDILIINLRISVDFQCFNATAPYCMVKEWPPHSSIIIDECRNYFIARKLNIGPKKSHKSYCIHYKNGTTNQWKGRKISVFCLSFIWLSRLSFFWQLLTDVDLLYFHRGQPQHWELHALLFIPYSSCPILHAPTLHALLLSRIVCGFFNVPWTFKGCETGHMVYSPYPRRRESLNRLQM